MAFKLNIKNLDKALSEIDVREKNVNRIVNNEFQNFGQLAVNDAKTNVRNNKTTDRGQLIGSLHFKVENLEVRLGAYVAHAAYLEFGTKGFAESYISSLPAEYADFAKQFKNSGEGTFADLLKSIIGWVKRKGIKPEPRMYEQEDNYSFGKLRKGRKRQTIKDEQLQIAYAISIKIIRDGIKAQPFLIPAFEKNKIILIKNLKRELNVK